MNEVKLTKLAHACVVRNHIATLINNRNTPKNLIHALNKVLIAMDGDFIRECLAEDKALVYEDGFDKVDEREREVTTAAAKELVKLAKEGLFETKADKVDESAPARTLNNKVVREDTPDLDEDIKLRIKQAKEKVKNKIKKTEPTDE